MNTSAALSSSIVLVQIAQLNHTLSLTTMLNLRKINGTVVTSISLKSEPTSTAHPSHVAAVYLPGASEQLGGGAAAAIQLQRQTTSPV